MKLEERDSGFTLVLFAMLCLAIISVVAIAIDIASLGTSVAQGRGNSRYAALASIEAYFASKAETHDEKFDAAKVRLDEIAGLNKVFSAGGYQSAMTTTATNSSMNLTAGKWYYALPSSGQNPCNQGSPPCFVPRTGSDTVNAFRVQGYMYEGVKTFFASILGFTETKVSVDTIATITPRQGCFIVDLSPSMTRDTHIPDKAHGAAYGFYLQNPINPGASYSWHDERWQAMATSYPRRESNPTDPTIHYADDYMPVTLLNNNDYTASGASSNYRKYHPDPTTTDTALQALYKANPAKYQIDFRRLPGYDGPEPLTTIMSGLRTAVNLFRTRSVAGDKMCLIFYDNYLSWPRVVTLTDNYDYIDDLIEGRTSTMSMGDVDLASAHGLFPSKDSFTNILMSLTEAERQFKKEKLDNPGLPVSQFMVLITDGLSNCRACDKALNPQYDRDGDGDVDDMDRWSAEACYQGNGQWSWAGTPMATQCSPTGSTSWLANSLQCKTASNISPNDGCKWMNTNGNNTIDKEEWDAVTKAEGESYQCRTSAGCQNSYQAYELATAELKNYVNKTISPQRIPIHVMLVGKQVAPNTRDIEDPDKPGTCKSDERLRGEGGATSYVEGANPPYKSCNKFWYESYLNCDPKAVTDFRDMSETAPFKQANADMYDIAKMTRGIWAPLRATSSNCVVDDCIPGQTRTEDPQCRSMDEQVSGYMEQIMGQNPYTISYSN